MKFVLFVTLIWSILDSGWSITDEDLVRIEAGLSQIQVLTKEIQDLKNENQAGLTQIQILRDENQVGQAQIRGVINENKELRRKMDHLEVELSESRERVDHLEEELTERVIRLEKTCGAESEVHGQDLAQNITIEERVTILEGEMTIVQNDVMEVKEEVTNVEDLVAFLFDEQVIQDERIYDLEQDAEDLDSRVEVLEANGGGGGNVTALEERVETLEGTAAEHEADIEDLDSATSNLDGRVETLEGETSELQTRLTAAETMIEDLQATDVELDSRISDLEEGGGGATNETTIAFRAVMDRNDDNNIPFDSVVIFSDVQLNEGNGYDPATGTFTVPSGGEGHYYFATHFTVQIGNYVYIDIRVNDVTVCTMFDENQDGTYRSNGGCNAVVFLAEGDEVQNVYWTGSDSTPVHEGTNGVYNGFTGFRI